jgi:hypothetical protein
VTIFAEPAYHVRQSLFDRGLLNQTIRASMLGYEGHLGRLVHCENDYFDRWSELANLSRSVNAAQLRHAHVHDDEVGT